MLGSYRRNKPKIGLIAAILATIVITASVIVWGQSKSAEYQRRAYDETRHHAENTKQEIRKTCGVIALRKPDKCATEKADEHRAYERDEQDLVAQKQSALWAFIMGAAAVVGMGLSAVGVALVWTTFNATKKANQIAQTAFEYQVRPWIQVGVSTTALRFTDTDISVRVHVDCENLGQSPANRLSVCAFILEGHWPSPRILNVMPTFFEVPADEWQEATIFHGQNWKRAMVVEAKNIMGVHDKACLVVVARYTSPANFGRFHHTCRIFDFANITTFETVVDFTNPASVRIRQRENFANYAE